MTIEAEEQSRASRVVVTVTSHPVTSTLESHLFGLISRSPCTLQYLLPIDPLATITDFTMDDEYSPAVKYLTNDDGHSRSDIRRAMEALWADETDRIKHLQVGHENGEQEGSVCGVITCRVCMPSGCMRRRWPLLRRGEGAQFRAPWPNSGLGFIGVAAAHAVAAGLYVFALYSLCPHLLMVHTHMLPLSSPCRLQDHWRPAPGQDQAHHEVR